MKKARLGRRQRKLEQTRRLWRREDGDDSRAEHSCRTKRRPLSDSGSYGGPPTAAQGGEIATLNFR
jgi:hypothetical protein